MNNNQKIGKFGEDLACSYLINNKFKILNRNHRESFNEIDIISKSFDGILVFFEVKTIKQYSRISLNILPEHNMTHNKFLKIKNGCLMFVAKHPELINPAKGWRIDLIAVLFDFKNMPHINHYKNIYN